MIDYDMLRQKSLATAQRLGYLVNESLPLLQDAFVTKSCDEIVDRILSMECVPACAYGFEKKRAITWHDHGVRTDLLTGLERNFLQSDMPASPVFKEQIEGLWALLWSVTSASLLDFGSSCPNDLVARLPDLKGSASSASFRRNAKVRRTEEIIAACDLAYCLHWAFRDAALKRRTVSSRVAESVIVERRRALEWLCTDAKWDEIPLDT